MTYLQPQYKTDHEPFPSEKIYTSFQDKDYKYQQTAIKNVKFNHVGRMALQNNFPFVDTTTYREEFTTPKKKTILNPEPEAHQFKSPQCPNVGKPFQGKSSYKQEFKDSAFMEEIRQLNSQKTNRNNQMNHHRLNSLNGWSSYNLDYKPFRLSKEENNCGNQRRLACLPSLKFEGTTTYRNDYKQLKLGSKSEANRCEVDFLPVPSFNNINKGNHIYYDSIQKRFV